MVGFPLEREVPLWPEEGEAVILAYNDTCGVSESAVAFGSAALQEKGQGTGQTHPIVLPPWPRACRLSARQALAGRRAVRFARMSGLCVRVLRY